MFWEWMRWEQRLMLLAAGCFALAFVYAQFDEDFGDWLSWVHRELAYTNGVKLHGDSGGPYRSLSWSAREAGDTGPNALVVDWPAGRLTAQDLTDAQGLLARGWQVFSAFPAAGSLVLRTPGTDENASYMQAQFYDGVLHTVLVRAATPLSVTVQGKTATLPASKARVIAALGPPVKETRINAINGRLPD
jgi:hypothetical protein